MKTKTCSKCGEEKVETEYSSAGYIKKDGSIGRRGTCRGCISKQQRLYQDKHSEELAAKKKQWRVENCWREVLIQSRVWAKKLGYMPCTATAEEIERAHTGKCHNCGMTEEQHIQKTGNRLYMDHSHISGEFRGWLCCQCNFTDMLVGVSA